MIEYGNVSFVLDTSPTLTLNRIPLFFAFLVTLICGCINSEPLRIAAWNLEHLSIHESEGCIPRTEADFEQIRESIVKQEFDIVAFQEVKDIASAEKIFPSNEWNIELSRRPAKASTQECQDALGRYVSHLATGFAIRKEIDYTRNRDLRRLGLTRHSHRWGTDITILADTKLRLLSVHLATGCWSSVEDQDSTRQHQCENLKRQFDALVRWRDARIKKKIPFVILGDFNRRLALPEDWGWTRLNKDDKLKLLTSGVKANCDSRNPAFIDHLVVADLSNSLYVENSFLEGPRIAEHPDHCALSAVFDLK